MDAYADRLDAAMMQKASPLCVGLDPRLDKLPKDVTAAAGGDAGKALLRWSLEVLDDWADTLTLSYVMADLERGERRFYARDNGQAMVLYYLDAAVASEVNALSGGALRPVTGDP